MLAQQQQALAPAPNPRPRPRPRPRPSPTPNPNPNPSPSPSPSPNQVVAAGRACVGFTIAREAKPKEGGEEADGGADDA